MLKLLFIAHSQRKPYEKLEVPINLKIIITSIAIKPINALYIKNELLNLYEEL